jgi:hypothetical protein
MAHTFSKLRGLPHSAVICAMITSNTNYMVNGLCLIVTLSQIMAIYQVIMTMSLFTARRLDRIFLFCKDYLTDGSMELKGLRAGYVCYADYGINS